MLKIVLLLHLEKHETHPYALLKIMWHRKHGMLSGLTKNDLYNAMNSLEKQGFIKSKPITIGLVMRKHYELTPKGRRAVRTSKRIMIKYFLEVKKLMEELNE